MKKEDYQISFNVPAFLGDAEQKSAWRTPPFKALIQQWWRVAVAKEHNYDWHKIRESEGRLFGHAWLKDSNGKDWAMRSRVRIRLAECKIGSLNTWGKDDPKVKHPEVRFPVGSQLYLGYGPLDFNMGLKHSPAIEVEEKNLLTLIYPKEDAVILLQVIQLITWFGSIGGRSRNGWGSMTIQANGIHDISFINANNSLINKVTRPLSECLKLDWPHAIGSDGKGVLIWKTIKRANWRLVMKDLAEIKINFRTALPFPKTAPNGFQDRHLLAYPVTNHKIHAWTNTGRLANQIRFKVVKEGDKFFAVIVHLPCALPAEMSQSLRHDAPSIQKQIEVWQAVHRSLDDQQNVITRITQ